MRLPQLVRAAGTDRILATLLVAPFMAQADATIANVATPSIRADLHASGAELELVIGGYLIAFAVLLITGARLGQSHGYRRAFLAGVGTFTLASLICALAPSAIVLIAARVVQGGGAALMFPQTLTGIQLQFSGAARARAIGLYAIALSVGAVTGQILGGALISADLAGSGWRSIFFVNVPIGVAVLAVAVRSLPVDSAVVRRDVDLRGVGLLSLALLLIVVPLALGRSEGWPLWTWLSLGASAPALASFVAAERRVAAAGGAPLVNIDALVRPAVAWGLPAVSGATGTYYGLLFTLALYLQQGLGHSPLVSGLTLVSWVAAFGFAGQLVRRLPEAVRVAAAPIGCTILAAAYSAISAAMFAGDHAEVLLIVLLGAGGLGLGLQFSAAVSHMTNAVPERYAPDISGVTTTAMQVAGAVGVAAFGTAYLGFASAAGPSSATHAFALVTAGFGAVALLSAAGAHRSTRVASARRSAR